MKKNPNYLEKSPMGHYGCYKSHRKNILVSQINELVDEYNKKINTFETGQENDDFHKDIMFKINNLLEKISKIDYNPKEIFFDWNELSLDQMVEYLREKYKYNSSGDSKCIYHLIEFYDKHKSIES